MNNLLKNKWTLGILCAIPILAIAMGLFAFSMLPKSTLISIDGDIEIITIDYYAKVSGEIQDIYFEMGQMIEKGDIIASMKTNSIQSQIAQLKETLLIKEANLRQLTNDEANQATAATKKMAQNAISICEETMKTAQENVKHGQEELAIQQQLYDAGAISQAELHQSQRALQQLHSVLATAEFSLESARNYLDTIRYPNNSDSIQAMEADIRLSQLQIEQLEQTLQDYEIIAIESGILMEKTVTQGSFAVVGQSLFQQSKEEEKHFVFYLPEDNIHSLSYGDTIVIHSLNNSKKGETYTAQIDYIDYKSVYTPRESESTANKNKRSMKIKAKLEHPANVRAGERCRVQLDTNLQEPIVK